MGSKTRQKLLSAARQLFAERGFYGATTREISRVAGVHETSLFRNFGSKEALFDAVFDAALSEALHYPARVHAFELAGWARPMMSYARSVRD